jgi:RimJ/RimL family protein N-acetyltransferase
MTPIATARLLLRAPVPADLARFHAIHSDPAANRYNPAGPMATMDVAATAFSSWLQHWEQHGFGQWTATALDAPGTVIGFGGLALRAYGSRVRVNLGYRLDPAYFGQGYATELATAARDAGFGLLGLPELYGLVRPDHQASIRVLEKIGMQLVELLDDVPRQAYSRVYRVQCANLPTSGN